MSLPRTGGTKGTLLALATLFLLGACVGKGPLEVYGQPPGTWAIAVGQDLEVNMGTVGPGEFLSPPMLAGSSVIFTGVSQGPIVPAGARQVFHFKGVLPGTTIIRFQNRFTDPAFARPDVIDTVIVR